MEERRYTLSEIDRIRHAVDRCWQYEVGGSYLETDRMKQIEETTRTYLIGGIGPEEVEEKVKRLEKEYQAAWERELRERDERRLIKEYGPTGSAV